MGQIHSLLDRFGVEEMRRLASLEDKTQRLCVEAAHEVMSDEDQAIGIAHAGFAMAALPHKKISESIWRREGGSIQLLVESGLDKENKAVGVPFGAMARLILLYLQTQAVRTRSREVELGSSMNAWLKAMGVSVGGKTYIAVRDQANRISRCRLTFTRINAGAEIITNGAFVRDAIMPVESENGNQLSFWKEAVRLDEGFYESLIEHPLPLREIAIRQISNKSKAIDIYIWLAYRLHVLNDPLTLSWNTLKNQFGPEYKELRYFKKDIVTPLKIALSVYPEAKVQMDDKYGIILYPSPPPIPEKRIGK
ncbi:MULTISPECIES: replication protein RepA [Acetobacter]|uniref:Plasmid Encoded RepA Protein n=2 Tax=Acetobacter TaxID=434 RepID=F1YRZ9_9PROT|nr:MULTISPECIES: replication protein RepA [Acetobacter]GBR58081.1 plasmid replication initiator RepA [Acetobacter senegalensis DSM 18889]ANA15156.1 pirin [Acetobacter oryzifermentans]ATI13494.1 pirin [Acetobacter pomorum]AXC27798.1 pirin [Acetobacter sp. JWB]EGE48451.1 Plasmid Encoded RepA Protein [Acetobacter pomorum DM001]